LIVIDALLAGSSKLKMERVPLDDQRHAQW